MSPRQACLNCLNRDAPALLEAALWMAVEHDPQLQPAEVLQRFNDLQQQVSCGLPCLPASELAQPLVRRLWRWAFTQIWNCCPAQPAPYCIRSCSAAGASPWHWR